MPNGAHGLWNELDGKIAMFVNAQWIFFIPSIGHTSWVEDEGKVLILLSDGWHELMHGSNVSSLAISPISGAVRWYQINYQTHLTHRL